MPRLKNAVPKYRLHKSSGQAIVTLNGKDFLLGPYDSRDSRAKYDRLIAEWLQRDRQPMVQAGAGLMIWDLVLRYWRFAQKKYVRRGKPTADQDKIKTANKHLLKLYELHLASEFGPMQLKIVRQSMIDAGWARTYINQQVAVIVRMFKWGVTEGLIPAGTHMALDLVDGLRRGESGAKETRKRRGIDGATVEATLFFLSPTVRAMIELQQATGARPGEICVLCPCDLDRSGDVWEFKPTEHKGEWIDHERTIYIGPRGQDVLRPFLLRAADAYCFSPVESMAWHRAERHARRQTPLSCGNKPGSKSKPRPKRTPKDRYTTDSYRRAIHRACDQAFPAPDDITDDRELMSAWLSEHRWSPHQLRHTMATRVRKEFDIEAAKAVLGHSATNVTGIYAEVDRQRAVEVARKIG